MLPVVSPVKQKKQMFESIWFKPKASQLNQFTPRKSEFVKERHKWMEENHLCPTPNMQASEGDTKAQTKFKDTPKTFEFPEEETREDTTNLGDTERAGHTAATEPREREEQKPGDKLDIKTKLTDMPENAVASGRQTTTTTAANYINETQSGSRRVPWTTKPKQTHPFVASLKKEFSFASSTRLSHTLRSRVSRMSRDTSSARENEPKESALAPPCDIAEKLITLKIKSSQQKAREVTENNIMPSGTPQLVVIAPGATSDGAVTTDNLSPLSTSPASLAETSVLGTRGTISGLFTKSVPPQDRFSSGVSIKSTKSLPALSTHKTTMRTRVPSRSRELFKNDPCLIPIEIDEQEASNSLDSGSLMVGGSGEHGMRQGVHVTQHISSRVKHQIQVVRSIADGEVALSTSQEDEWRLVRVDSAQRVMAGAKCMESCDIL